MKGSVRICLLLLAIGGVVHAQTFKTPIQHVIIVVQENRTPDNLFQDPTLLSNGADIQKAPSNAAGIALGSCWDIGHGHGSWNTELLDQQNGRGFCDDNVGGPAGCDPLACSPDTYVSDPAIQPYWKLAETNGFANYMFQTNEGPSFLAHQFLFGGSSAPVAYPTLLYNHFASENMLNPANSNEAGCIAPSGQQTKDIDANGEEDFDYSYNGMLGYPCYDHGTLTDLVTANHLSWRWYGFSKPGSIWNAPNAISHVCVPSNGNCTRSDWKNVDLKDTDIFADIPNCKLANVSWVIPDGSYSDHPGGLREGGPDWVASIVSLVGNSNGACDNGKGYWNDTAILITWDDWGGFYDHVPPYEQLIGCVNPTFGCGYVAGFRVPLIVVSAYTPAGYISGHCTPSTNGQNNAEVCLNNKPPYWHDFGSILNFTEYVMGLPQGGISKTGPAWFFDDYWAQDYYKSGTPGCTQQLCPYGLSDFFNFGAAPVAFTPVQALTYHTAQDFINLVGGQPEDPDNETP
ncbi:MAG TPA: alkaline phosphatase family protein [Terriglobales bacterium]|nr:alkaline phosphatase family protein [Terriglobales bacterium]